MLTAVISQKRLCLMSVLCWVVPGFHIATLPKKGHFKRDDMFRGLNLNIPQSLIEWDAMNASFSLMVSGRVQAWEKQEVVKSCGEYRCICQIIIMSIIMHCDGKRWSVIGHLIRHRTLVDVKGISPASRQSNTSLAQPRLQGKRHDYTLNNQFIRIQTNVVDAHRNKYLMCDLSLFDSLV